MKLKISEIKVGENRRGMNETNVENLMKSIADVGLLNPITITHKHDLIAGAHRLEACKRLGWEEIECTVTEIDGLKAELAEIDENLIRHNLDRIDEGEQLLRRKEIYEALHPETKKGAFNQYTKVLKETVSISKPKSSKETVSPVSVQTFADDTAEKMGITPRSVNQKIQIAKNLSPEVKALAKENGISEKKLLELSRIKEPEKQKEVAQKMAKPAPVKPKSIHQSVTELKTNSEATIAPDVFLQEYTAFTRDIIHRFEWYKQDMYRNLYPALTEEERKKVTALNTDMLKAAEEVQNLMKGT